MRVVEKYILYIAFILCNLAFAGADRPNIVWLVTEDNSAEWLKLYNKDGASMPYIEKLAKDGLVFNNAFSCAPVCSVARSTIISGCYAPRLGVQYHRKEQMVPMPKGIKMFPYYLRQAGYHTTNNSKEDYNFVASDKKGVWDESSRKATYKKRKPGQPFFHVQNYTTTHESCMHDKRKDYFDKTKTDKAAVEVNPYHPDTDAFRHAYARYHDMHAEVDAQMGKLIDQLEAEGLMDDTFIFFYGDHGGNLARGKGYAYDNGLHVPMVVYVPKNFKHLAPFDSAQDRPSTRGSRINGAVEFIDLSATVLNLADAEIPKGIDGEPFLGKGVELKELNNRDVSFGYADRFDEKYDLVRTVRKGSFRYQRNYQPFNFDGLYNNYRYLAPTYREWQQLFSEGRLNEQQSQFFMPRAPEGLYDLENDPHQVSNLAGDPKHAKKLKELRKLLQKQVKGMPDLSFIPEPVFLKEGGDNPTAYGQQQKKLIGRLVDIADLSFEKFGKAEKGISKALDSENAWERYWGLIVCSSFGDEANPFYAKAKDMAETDSVNLVRVRAAEFLAITKQADPNPVIADVIGKVDDRVEANLIMNTVALLQDGHDYDVGDIVSAVKAKGGQLDRRLSYLRK